jgi:hypothetical protein
MNRAALRALGAAADKDFVATWGKNKFGPEDLLTGVAMTRAGISIDNSAEPSTGRHPFLPLGPQVRTPRTSIHLVSLLVRRMSIFLRWRFMGWLCQAEYTTTRINPKFWFYRIGVAPQLGKECCAREWVATHYVNPPHMFLLDDYEAVRCTADPDSWPHLQLGHAKTHQPDHLAPP